MNRREFIKSNTAALVAGNLDFLPKKSSTRIEISKVASNFSREALHPYAFKGSAITDSWQVVSGIESSSGIRKIGLCTQGVLWSDARVFLQGSEAAGNAIMYAMTEYALQKAKGASFENPLELLDFLLPEVLAYGQRITGLKDLRTTFGLNALVSIDNAAWLLYAQENAIHTFDSLVPVKYKLGLSKRHEKVASIPSFPTGTPMEKIKKAVQDGYFMMKLKTGAPGTQKEMLQKDIDFLKQLHRAVGHAETPHTKSGKIPYYFDMNGRYEKKEFLLKFLEVADAIGALNQIAVIEEPFPEELHVSVKDIPVCVAADESAHTEEDVDFRIELGYKAIVVKAVAKTLSMTMRMAQKAAEKGIPCFCADLTVNPFLIEWNKMVAARLPAFPDLEMGLLEANGHQYYKEWQKLKSHHPYPNAVWANSKDGLFETNQDFYAKNGGIFEEADYFKKMLNW